MPSISRSARAPVNGGQYSDTVRGQLAIMLQTSAGDLAKYLSELQMDQGTRNGYSQ